MVVFLLTWSLTHLSVVSTCNRSWPQRMRQGSGQLLVLYGNPWNEDTPLIRTTAVACVVSRLEGFHCTLPNIKHYESAGASPVALKSNAAKVCIQTMYSIAVTCVNAYSGSHLMSYSVHYRIWGRNCSKFHNRVTAAYHKRQVRRHQTQPKFCT